jgi:hypothetical protein
MGKGLIVIYYLSITFLTVFITYSCNKLILVTGMSGDLPEDLHLDRLYAEMDAVMAGPVDMDVDEMLVNTGIHERLRRYLEERRGNPATSTGAASDNSSAPGGNSSYLAIKRFNNKKLEVPCLNGGTSAPPDIGSFHVKNDTVVAPVEKSIYSKKRNISFSFDPSTMTCLACPSKHAILEGGGTSLQGWFSLWLTSASPPQLWVGMGSAPLSSG